MALKILVCDDAGFIREILTQTLFELGYDVVGEARDGVEVLAKALRLQPDVILMDLVLPLKNGAEAAFDIKSILPDVHIVAMSTVDEKFLEQKAQQAGCQAFLSKPFTKLEIKNLMASFAARKSSEVKHG